MAGSCAYTCSKIFPECAFVVSAGLDATNLPLIFAHLKLSHYKAHPVAPDADVFTAFTLS